MTSSILKFTSNKCKIVIRSTHVLSSPELKGGLESLGEGGLGKSLNYDSQFSCNKWVLVNAVSKTTRGWGVFDNIGAKSTVYY